MLTIIITHLLFIIKDFLKKKTEEEEESEYVR